MAKRKQRRSKGIFRKINDSQFRTAFWLITIYITLFIVSMIAFGVLNNQVDLCEMRCNNLLPSELSICLPQCDIIVSSAIESSAFFGFFVLFNTVNPFVAILGFAVLGNFIDFVVRSF